jgi:alpha-N-arabinofuranosidase
MAHEQHLEFRVSPSTTTGLISPLWFGHNLEHTRRSVSGGLAAQMVRNRKFAGKPQYPSGVAADWLPIGPRQTLFVLDSHRITTSNYRHIAKASYTRHYDEDRRGRSFELQCQFICGHTPDSTSGIAQDGLFLTAGRAYEGRVALVADRWMTVSVRLLSRNCTEPIHESRFAVGPEPWQLHQFAFNAPDTDPDARLEITFTGIGALAVGAVSLLPTDHFHGMRFDVVALLEQIGVTILRWPGGNFVGDYRWQDGLLAVDERGPLQAFMQPETLPYTLGYDTHEIGTDEFIALCRRIGAEPYLTINLGCESPEQAAAWVEYCNGGPDTTWGSVRASRGHAVPYAVKYWSLGNEMGYGHMEGPNSPARYAEKAMACARAMKAVDPSIQLVTSGAWWVTEWFAEGLAPLGPVIDHVSHHWYHRPMRAYVGDDWKAEYTELMDCPAKMMEDLEELRAKFAERLPSDRPIGLAFDEWNVWYAWYRAPGVVEGLYTAGMLDAFCRSAASCDMSIGCYFEPVNEGAILVDPAGARLTPAGQAFVLFRHHHGNRAVETVPLRGPGPIAITVSRPEPDTQHPTTNTLVVTLVNRSPDTDCRVKLVFADDEQPEVVDGIRLVGDDCLPGSILREEPQSGATLNGNAVEVPIPHFGMVLMRLTYRTQDMVSSTRSMRIKA